MPSAGRPVILRPGNRLGWGAGWVSGGDSLVSRSMADTQGPQGNHDPAGSTQMFRAFVDDGPQSRGQQAQSSGPRTGVIIGVVVAVVVVAAVVWLALK